MKARYRNKLNKIIVELEYEGTWYYIKTLPDPAKLFEKECLDKVSFLEARKYVSDVLNTQEVPTININGTPKKDIHIGEDASIRKDEVKV